MVTELSFNLKKYNDCTRFTSLTIFYDGNEYFKTFLIKFDFKWLKLQR